MATRNYRQAKRSREESRKKRQTEKMLRRVNRAAAAGPGPDTQPDAVAIADKPAP